MASECRVHSPPDIRAVWKRQEWIAPKPGAGTKSPAHLYQGDSKRRPRYCAKCQAKAKVDPPHTMNIEELSPLQPSVIGLISDTHGLVRPDVHAALSGVDYILHAGDVGEGVLAELQIIAPVRAVYGNTDDPGDPSLSATLELRVGGVSIHVSHGHEVGSPKPEKLVSAYDADVIVYGHTHRQQIIRLGTQLIVNPGAAGARRFNLRPSVARLTISSGTASAQIIELND